MILHLITDEKFTDYAIRQFGAIAGTSEFLLVLRAGQDVRHVKLVNEVRVVEYESEQWSSVLASLLQYKAIVSHGLFEQWQWEIIQKAPSSVKVAWQYWGGEIYGRSNLLPLLLAPNSHILAKLKELTYCIKGKQVARSIADAVPAEVYSRIDYCLSDVAEDVAYAEQVLGKKYITLWHNYYSVEETVGSLKNSRSNGNDVIVGNSCCLEGNHLDAFLRLKKVDLPGNVVVPLSYGDSWLRPRLLRMGKLLFGNEFMPLTDFMPLTEYNAILCSCGTALMIHYRQQAFGNIFTLLWLGSRVYMSERSALYQYFKRLGCVVFAIEHEPLTNGPLSEDETMLNRTILSQEYSVDNMQLRIKQLVETLNN